MTGPGDKTASDMASDVSGGTRADRVGRRLDDLRHMGGTAAGIRAGGLSAYLADGIQGETLRLAGRQLVVQVATVAEKLPAEFKAGYPEVPWDDIRGMRNLVAHHYDKVQDRFVWDALGVDIPVLLRQLGLDA